MHIDVITSEKNMLEFHIDNTTIAEVLRVYLNENGAKFAAWRRVHPDKPLVMRVETESGTPLKAVKDAIAAIQKEDGAITTALKK